MSGLDRISKSVNYSHLQPKATRVALQNRRKDSKERVYRAQDPVNSPRLKSTAVRTTLKSGRKHRSGYTRCSGPGHLG